MEIIDEFNICPVCGEESITEIHWECARIGDVEEYDDFRDNTWENLGDGNYRKRRLPGAE